MHDVPGASLKVLRCVNAYMWATPMGYGSCVVQHLQACGSVGMPIYLIRTQLASYRGAFTQHSKPEIVWFLLNGSFMLPCTGRFQCIHFCTPVYLLLATAWTHATSTCAQCASLSCALHALHALVLRRFLTLVQHCRTCASCPLMSCSCMALIVLLDITVVRSI